MKMKYNFKFRSRRFLQSTLQQDYVQKKFNITINTSLKNIYCQ